MIIHVDKLQQHPENNVKVNLLNIIHLIKTGQHYDLLKQTIDVDGLPCNDEEKEESYCDCPKRHISYVKMHRKPKVPQDNKRKV